MGLKLDLESRLGKWTGTGLGEHVFIDVFWMFCAETTSFGYSLRHAASLAYEQEVFPPVDTLVHGCHHFRTRIQSMCGLDSSCLQSYQVVTSTTVHFDI